MYNKRQTNGTNEMLFENGILIYKQLAQKLHSIAGGRTHKVTQRISIEMITIYEHNRRIFARKLGVDRQTDKVS